MRSLAATERARYIEEADNIFTLMCDGLLEPWQIEHTEQTVDSRWNSKRYMTAKEIVDTITPFGNDRVAKYYGTCSKQHHQLHYCNKTKSRDATGATNGPTERRRTLKDASSSSTSADRARCSENARFATKPSSAT